MATHQIKTACTRDCPDGCSMIATVENDKIIRLGGDPDHPVTQGFLCHRTSQFLKRQYDPRRITRPMVRRNKGGENDHWETVSMDEALDLVASKLIEYRDELGPASILNYRCGGSMGMMKYVTDYFFQEFGPVTVKSGDICAGAGDWAQGVDFGIQDSNDVFDILNAKTIFIWGKNVYVSHVHLLPILKKAKANGARIVLIDPVEHRTAKLCDEYIPVAPGGDAAIALGIARWMLDNNRFEPTASEYCDNWNEYLELISRNDVAEWAEIAGLADQRLAELAATYSNGPTTILAGWGMQRRRNGAAIIRAIDALAAVSGNVGVPGGCISFYFPRKSAFDLSFVNDGLAPRTVSEPLLGRDIANANDPPIKMVFVSAANPVTNIPDSKAVAQALSERFTVVVDMFMTDTAACADVLLPAATMLEDSDLIGAYGHHYINAVKPVVNAPDEAMTDYEILKRLATRLGMPETFSRDASEWQEDMVANLAEHDVRLANIENESVRNPFATQIAFEGRIFPTATGRVNLLTEYDHPSHDADPKFPLRLMAISTDQAQASQWQADQQIGPALLTINPGSANGYSEGDTVQIESKIGSLPVELRFDERMRPEIAQMDKGGWFSADRCANALIPAEASDHGECAVYYDTPIRIVR